MASMPHKHTVPPSKVSPTVCRHVSLPLVDNSAMASNKMSPMLVCGAGMEKEGWAVSFSIAGSCFLAIVFAKLLLKQRSKDIELA